MANHSPTIAEAKAVAGKYKKEGIIIFYFGDDGIGYASYGKDRRACQAVKTIADRWLDQIERVSKQV